MLHTLCRFSVTVAVLFAAACSPAAAPPPTVAPAPPSNAPAATAPSAAPAAASPSAAAAKPTVPPAPIAAASPVASPAAAAKPVASPSAAPAAGGAAAAKPSALGPVSGEIVVFAASSLTDVFQDMVADFQTANPDAKITFNFGASSQLATQLGQGASADDFASADTVQMDAARKAGAITGDSMIFARNRLVLITPKDNPRQITGVKDLANPGIKFVTAQPSVPIGTYTMQMLDKAVADPTYGADFKDKVVANIVSQEDNVRQVVSKVQLGEADAAVVYSTDPTPQVRDQLQLIQIPDALQTLATYPIAVAKGSNTAGGAAFAAYLVGPAGQATLARWGFLPPTDTSTAGAPTPASTGGQPPAAGGSPAAPAGSAPIPSVASSTFSPEVAISGLVGSPRSFTIDDLKKLPAETVQVSYQAGQGITSGSFTGTRLLNVFDAAGGAKLPNDIINAKLRVTVMVTGADGYQVALGWGELDPEFGAAPILLAYLSNEQPMGDKQGMARLVVPGDKRGGRYVSTVKSIELRDPGPALP